VSRAAHVLRDPSGPESNYNFVLINPYTASSVVVELHHSRRVADQLHIQSAYPSGEDIGASKSVVAVTTYPSKAVTESSFNG
jgi:hypothetical protein